MMTTQMTSAFDRVFIFGLGYTGLGVANVIMKKFPDCVVSGTCRSEEKKESLTNLGIDAHCFNVDGEDPALDETGRKALLSSSHVLSTIPPVYDMDTDPVLAFHAADLKETKPWLAYLSTTGVYGNHDGEWVTESSPCLAPKSSRAFPRLAVETKWLSLLSEEEEYKAFVFRLAGIYGPGRSALTTIKKDLSFEYKEEKKAGNQEVERQSEEDSTPNYVNRIHVGDIADTIVKTMRMRDTKDGSNGDSGGVCVYGVYNLSDDEPAPRSQVMSFARGLLSSEVVSCDDGSTSGSGGGENGEPKLLRHSEGTFKPTLGARAARRVRENKRVNNTLMKEALLGVGAGAGVGLRYPTYREGLSAEAEGETYPF